MVDEVAAVLLKLRERDQYIRPNDFVFPAADGTVADPSALRRRYEKALKRAGLPHLRFHDLRHTFLARWRSTSPRSSRSRTGWVTPTSRPRCATSITRAEPTRQYCFQRRSQAEQRVGGRERPEWRGWCLTARHRDSIGRRICIDTRCTPLPPLSSRSPTARSGSPEFGGTRGGRRRCIRSTWEDLQIVWTTSVVSSRRTRNRQGATGRPRRWRHPRRASLGVVVWRPRKP
jgi:hypothetical protein